MGIFVECIFHADKMIMCQKLQHPALPSLPLWAHCNKM